MVDKVRVLIVDDSAFFRKRIRQELERAGEITIAGEAENGREAVQMSAELCPDLITMDVSMPLMDGISAVRAIMRDHPTNILKERGSSVWTQHQASSVVFGMPYAVAKGGYSDRVIALDDMGAALRGLA